MDILQKKIKMKEISLEEIIFSKSTKKLKINKKWSDISFTFSFYFLLSIFISLFNILLYFFISAIFIQFFSLMLIDLFFYCSFNIFIIFLHYSSIPWIFLVTFYFLLMLKY